MLEQPISIQHLERKDTDLLTILEHTLVPFNKQEQVGIETLNLK
jgi:hypothetical protein